MPHKKILVIGSSNMDMVIKVPRLPKPGETILGGEFSMVSGGKGANQAVAAARAGGQVTFISRLGTDVFGDQCLAGYVKDGIDVTLIQRDAAFPTGVALIYVDKEGENSIAVASGANSELRHQQLQLINSEDLFSGVGCLLMQLEIPLKTIEYAAEQAHQAGIPIILNPAPASLLPKSLLEKIHVLTPNETEASSLTGIKVTDPESANLAASVLLDGGVRIVVITMGSQGSLVATKTERKLVPAFPVQAVDTTAAGDTFNGALSVALAEGQTLHEAVRFASAAAAICVTRLGAQPSAPYRNEIDNLLH